MDLDTAVSELYSLAPDAFLGARRDLAAKAKAAKDTGLAKAIESVRKPTAAAWAVNRLVRVEPAEIGRLLDLAGDLQNAQESMDGTALKRLGRERSTLVDALVRTTAEVVGNAGGSLSAAVAGQVRDTFVAALATTPAAQAVASGQLTRALSYAGFGEVDLSEAMAAPAPARRPALRVIAGGGGKDAPGGGTAAAPEPAAEPAPEPAPGPPSQPDPALVKRLREAERRSRETMTEAALAGDALSEATEALTSLDQQLAELDAQLKSARAGRDALVTARTDAAAANKTAQRTLRASLAEVDQVRAQLPDDLDD